MKTKDDIFTKFGEFIRETRKSKGLTQEQLSGISGCSLVFIYNVENGKSTLRFDKLIILLHTLGLQIKIEQGQSKIAIDNKAEQWETRTLLKYIARTDMLEQ